MEDGSKHCSGHASGSVCESGYAAIHPSGGLQQRTAPADCDSGGLRRRGRNPESHSIEVAAIVSSERYTDKAAVKRLYFTSR